MWLYKKIEGRIGCWTYKFLSRGGRLVFLKAVLQSILIYWATISYILKGILQKLRKKFFSFLWSANRHMEGITLAKWQLLASLKDLGGWGIKNSFLIDVVVGETTVLKWPSQRFFSVNLWQLKHYGA